MILCEFSEMCFFLELTKKKYLETNLTKSIYIMVTEPYHESVRHVFNRFLLSQWAFVGW